MYGGCESLTDNSAIVHNLLRRYQIWDGTDTDAKSHLKSQILVPLPDDEDEDLSQTENIIKFLNRHSKFGKNVHEIEEVKETLTSIAYKVVGADDDMLILVPKKIEDSSEVAFLDLVYQVQLVQFLKDKRDDGTKQFFPNVQEEVFVVNKNTGTILNYISVIEASKFSLINMLDGPTARGAKQNDLDEDGYRSQEIFTAEKYAYLYYKGLLLLEFLYDNGITHGQINANSLTISDDYTFTLSDFALSTRITGFAEMSQEEQEKKTTQVRGFNKHTVNEDIGN